MTLERPRLVGAVLARGRAASAARDLGAEGLAGNELVTAVRRDEGFAIEPPAGRRMRAGLVRGAFLGAVAGALAGFLLLLVIPPANTLAADLLVGGGSGALAGAFFGAYWGLNRERIRFWEQEDWAHVDSGPDEVLLVVDAGDRAETAARILTRHGGRVVEPVHPG